MVVITAIATMTVNRSRLSMPSDRPIVATMTSVDPRAFIPHAKASDSAKFSPPSLPPMKAPPNFPRLAMATTATSSQIRAVFWSIDKSALKPARPKNTGANKAVIRPRSCASTWRLSIGDSPTRIPATNAPNTVWTPMKCVVRAITPMMTMIAVTTGTSLTKLSLVQRIAANTIRRPKVRLSTRNSSVPSTLPAKAERSTAPCEASPKVIAMMIQPIVSSMIADATMT